MDDIKIFIDTFQERQMHERQGRVKDPFSWSFVSKPSELPGHVKSANGRPLEPRVWIQSDHVASMKRKNEGRHAGAPHPPSLSWHILSYHGWRVPLITLQRDKRGAGVEEVSSLSVW